MLLETEKDLHDKIFTLLEGQSIHAAKRILEHTINSLDYLVKIPKVQSASCSKLPNTAANNQSAKGE